MTSFSSSGSFSLGSSLSSFSFYMVAAVLLLMTGFAFLWDLPFHHWLFGWQKGAGVSWMPLLRGLSRYGDWPELMLLGGIGIVIARSLKNRVRGRYWVHLLLVAMLASTLSGAAVNLLRLTTGRTRPRVEEVQQGWYGLFHQGSFLVGKADFNSFPSGHTATAVGFALVLFLAAPGWGSIALCVAVAVAGSRLLLAAHHPSDIMAAILITWVVTWLVWERFRPNLKPR